MAKEHDPTRNAMIAMRARVERDLENSSFLSVHDCVLVANTILQLKLTGRVDSDLGFNESLMLVSSTRREVRTAYLLLIALYYAAGRRNFTQVIFNELYEKSTDALEKTLLLNTMVTAGASQSHSDSSPQSRTNVIVAGRHTGAHPTDSFELRSIATVLRAPVCRPPPEIVNRLLVYLNQAGFLHDEAISDLRFASHLASTTCNTLCQILRPRIRAEDAKYAYLIQPLLCRVAQCFDEQEGAHLGLPDPWFITNALKILRTFYPTRYLAGDSQRSPKPPPPRDNDLDRGRTSRIQRSASLILNLTARRHYQRRYSDAALATTGHRAAADGEGSPQSLTTLLGEVLHKIFSYETTRNFTPVQYRHYRNLQSMVRLEACRLVYALQPSDYWLDKATEETLAQFQSLNTNSVRNAIATWDVAAQDPSLMQSQSKILNALMSKISQPDVHSTIKIRIAQLLVKISTQDILTNGCGGYSVDEEYYGDDENAAGSLAADNCYDTTFLTSGVRKNFTSPHSIVNCLLLAMRRRDPKLIKMQLTNSICTLLKACQTTNEEAFIPVIFELLSVCQDVWKPLVSALEEKLSLRVLHAGEALIRERMWQRDGGGANAGSLKLTLYLMGELKECNVLEEVIELLGDWRGTCRSCAVRKSIVDEEAVCLGLDCARRLFMLVEDREQVLLKEFMSRFLRHGNLNVQTVATEAWLSIRSGFPPCATSDRN